MAQEEIRGCGFRKVGGLYLCGEYIAVPCDRLPYPLDVCPVCGGGIKVSRGFTKINPAQLFGRHTTTRLVDVITGGYEKATETQEIEERCKCHYPCFMCDPKDEPAFIMGVGEKYYKNPSDFQLEAQRLGVSKRIPFIPKDLELGVTILYLAHPKACLVKEPAVLQQAMAIVGAETTDQPRLVESEKVEYKLGIFSAFVPHRVEKLIWEHDATPEELESLKKRGITPIVIKDGDIDHI